MKKYEIMFILDPKEDSESSKDALKNLFKEHGAQIDSDKELGLKKLAYPINKKDRGSYYLYHVTMDPLKNEIIKKELNLKEFIMKYMIIAL